MAGPTKIFDGKRYTLYTNFSGTKRQATTEANRLRETGVWLVRMVKSPWGGWDLYTRPREKKHHNSHVLALRGRPWLS